LSEGVAIGDIDILRDEAQAHEVQPCRVTISISPAANKF